MPANEGSQVAHREYDDFAEIELEFRERVDRMVWCADATIDTRLDFRVGHCAGPPGHEAALGRSAAFTRVLVFLFMC